MFFYYYTISIPATAFFKTASSQFKNVNHGNCKRLFNL